MASIPMVKLCDLSDGQQGTVVRLEGGQGFLARMVSLAFTPGATVQVVRNSGHGPLIVAVLDTQIALGRNQASCVQVRREGGSCEG